MHYRAGTIFHFLERANPMNVKVQIAIGDGDISYTDVDTSFGEGCIVIRTYSGTEIILEKRTIKRCHQMFEKREEEGG